MDSPRRVPLRIVVGECMGRWFSTTAKAAQDGDKAAQSLLGQMLMSGYGTSQDTIQAVYWLQKAAAADDMDARRMLASLVPGGPGVGEALAIEGQATDMGPSLTPPSSSLPSAASASVSAASGQHSVGSPLPARSQVPRQEMQH